MKYCGGATGSLQQLYQTVGEDNQRGTLHHDNNRTAYREHTRPSADRGEHLRRVRIDNQPNGRKGKVQPRVHLNVRTSPAISSASRERFRREMTDGVID